MVWFKVDDSLHSHPKALATSLEAIGLWTLAGSWSGGHLTDGVVPDQAVSMLSRGRVELADELVAAGLWRRAKGGYRFHEWDADSDGTARNPTRSEATAARSQKSSGGAIGNHRRWHVARDVTDPKCPYCQRKQSSDNRSDSDRGTDGVSDPDPNPPVPARPDPISTDADASIERARAPVDDFELTDGLRRWVVRTFGPALDADHEFKQFVSHYRSTGARRKSWPDAFQKWCRDSVKHAGERAARASPANGRRPSTTEQRVSQAAAIKAELEAEENP